MADLGADVIKVEACQYPDWWRGLDKDPDAIERVLYEKSERFNFLQRGKRGITLDLTSAEGVRLLKELVRTADALLENNSAGVLRKLGLEYPRLAEVNPSIVMMSMSAYGSSGAWSDLRAYGSTLGAGLGVICGGGAGAAPPRRWRPHGRMERQRRTAHRAAAPQAHRPGPVHRPLAGRINAAPDRSVGAGAISQWPHRTAPGQPPSAACAPWRVPLHQQGQW
jgi:hypothetical protein